MATTIALQILAELDPPADHPLVSGALGYLANAYDETLGAWAPASSAVNDYPHAPWWAYDPARSGGDFALNPGAEIVGYLLRWGDGVPASLSMMMPMNVPMKVLVKDTINAVLARDQIESHELLCCIRLAEKLSDGDAHHERIAERLIAIANDVVQTDPEQWQSYCIKPLTAAPRPDSLLSDCLSVAINAQLDFEIGQQTETGAWEPHWSWFGNYPDDWERVRPGICAHVTLATLRALHAWGRLDGFRVS